MKRGNTALKRVVSVASVAAMAIAGAVLAAPAASAAVAFGDIAIRPTPIANATWVDVDGNLLTKQDYSVADYAASSTGALPTIPAGTSNQRTSSLQIAVDALALVKTDAITIHFTQPLAGAPALSVVAQPVKGAQLQNVAGYDGADGKATAAATAAALSGKSVASISSAYFTRTWTSAAPNDVTFEFNKDNPNTTANLDGTDSPTYLLTLNNIFPKLATDAAAAPIQATVTTPAGGTDVAALAYVGTLGVSTASTYAPNTTKISLGSATVKELSKAGFTDGGTYDISATANGKAVDIVGTPTVKSNNTSLVLDTVTPIAVSGGVATVKLAAATAQDNGAIESFTVSDLAVDGSAVPFGADIVLSVSDSAFPGASGNVGSLGDPADQAAAASATVKAAGTAPRIAGTNRNATAADIAAQFGTANAVVLANGLDGKQGADALAANFLAGTVGAPILLTNSSDALPSETQLGLVSVFKGAAGDADGNVTIYAMGKADSVSDAALAQAKSIAATAVNSGVTVKTVRVAGDDRYATSAKAASTAVSVDENAIHNYSVGGAFDKTAILASGQVNADALAAGGISWNAGIPVLLSTDADTLPTSVASAITDLKVKNVIILGSTDRVSQKVQDSLTADGIVVKRIAGEGAEGRYDTAVDLAEFAIDGAGLSLSLSGTLFLANGVGGFPDALAVGPLAGKKGNIVLTVSSSDTLPASVTTFLKANATDIPLTNVVALGGVDRITDAAIAAAQTAIGQTK